MKPIRAAVITVSDRGFAGEREDISGPLLADLLQQRIHAEVVEQTMIPDEEDQIAELLVELADTRDLDVIITTGGTGATPRDVTPEATLSVIDREMPGIPELLRMEGYRKTATAVLSRGVAGLRGQTLIVNLPGNPKAVQDGVQTLAPILPHAVQMMRGEHTEHDLEVHHA